MYVPLSFTVKNASIFGVLNESKMTERQNGLFVFALASLHD